MPLYDFKCPDGHVTERFFQMTDDGRPDAVQCKCGKRATRLFHFPHTKLAWHDPLRDNNGSDRMVIRAARQGEPAGPIDDGTATVASNLGLLD